MVAIQCALPGNPGNQNGLVLSMQGARNWGEGIYCPEVYLALEQI